MTSRKAETSDVADSNPNKDQESNVTSNKAETSDQESSDKPEAAPDKTYLTTRQVLDNLLAVNRSLTAQNESLLEVVTREKAEARAQKSGWENSEDEKNALQAAFSRLSDESEFYRKHLYRMIDTFNEATSGLRALDPQVPRIEYPVYKDSF